MRRAAFLVALAGCGKLLGLAPPHEQRDAAPSDGAAADASPDAAGPTMLHVRIGGTQPQGALVTSDVGGISCAPAVPGPAGTCDAQIPPHTAVTLTVASAGTGTFTGFVGAPGCTGTGPTCTFTPARDTTVHARWWGGNVGNIIFVSSTVQHPGSFDDIANADQRCRDLAAAAGLPAEAAGSGAGSYFAWLPTSTQTAGARLINNLSQQPQVWTRVDGQYVVRSFAQLEAGDFIYPVRLDEFGDDVGDDAIAVTDTNPDGTANGGTHCQDWASESTQGLVLAGEPAGGTDRWTSVTAIACNQDAHIYCVSALSSVGLSPVAPPGPILWVSSAKVAGNAGFGAMQGICNIEAMSHGFPPVRVPLVTPGGSQPVAASFPNAQFISGPPQRSDHVEIAPDMRTLLASTSWPVLFNLDAAGNYVDDDVWIGAGGFDNFATDCDGWTSSTGFGAIRPVATTRDHTFSQPAACTEQHRILCYAGPEVAVPRRAARR